MRKLAALLVAGVAFGVLVAVIKGQDTGVRDALGNTSAPWIVLPFAAGTLFSRARSAALAGLAVTLVSLLGFYVAEAAVLDLGPHPWWVDLRLTAGYVNVYERWGVVSGLLYGPLGWLWAWGSGRRSEPRRSPAHSSCRCFQKNQHTPVRTASGTTIDARRTTAI